MHPARLILSTAAAAAVPGPAAGVGLPKKDPGVAGPPFAPTSTAAAARGEQAGGTARGDVTLLFGGQCRPLLALKGHGEKGRTMLEGQCVDGGGQWWRTSLNLNRCIGARDGELVYQESCVDSLVARRGRR